MRILILTDRYPPYFEGAYELNCHRIAEALISRGHEISILTTKYGINTRVTDGQIHRILNLMRLNCHNKIQRRWRQLIYFYRAQQNYWLTRRLAKKMNPDLAFIWHMQDASILPIMSIQDLGIPVVYRIGSHWLIQEKHKHVEEDNSIKRWFQSGLLGFRHFEELKIDNAIFNSDSLLQSYQNADFNINNVIMIPSGIPDKWIMKKPIRSLLTNCFVKLLYVGRIEVEKGIEVAIKSIEYLINGRNYRDLSLDLIGRGELDFVNRIKEVVSSHNLENFVKFIGFLPHSNLMQRYRNYDILLFPTPKYEGLPMTILEAMSQGIPVIASNIGGPRDIIEDGRNGFLVCPNKPDKMAEAIEQIIKSPSLIVRMGYAAANTVKKKFKFEVMLDQYETFLKSIA